MLAGYEVHATVAANVTFFDFFNGKSIKNRGVHEK